MNDEKTVFACNPAALDAEQRARYKVLTERLFASAGRKASELPNNFAFDFAANEQNIRDVFTGEL